jgi:hypothetical protein
MSPYEVWSADALGIAAGDERRRRAPGVDQASEHGPLDSVQGVALL